MRSQGCSNSDIQKWRNYSGTQRQFASDVNSGRIELTVWSGDTCFPADALIFEKTKGFIEMKDLEIGNVIQTKNG